MKLMRLYIICGFVGLLSFFTLKTHADVSVLQQIYPDTIIAIFDDHILWADGTVMPIYDGKKDKTTQEKLDNPSLFDQMNQAFYSPGIPSDPVTYHAVDDPGRIRYEPFFRQMYGNSKQEVESHLVTIYWMPKYFGNQYPLLVTTINHVDQKLINISIELEMLVADHPEFLSYLDKPGGTFEWRVIANTNRLSTHSFGMTIDINTEKSDYWQWDLEHAGQAISEETPLIYRNSIPWEIVPIFEKYGFIWGGKWYHYDSMHFEYRPELLATER